MFRLLGLTSVVLLSCGSSGSPGSDAGTTAPHCGNGTIETNEECEGFELRGRTCGSEGFGRGTLKCTASCTIDASDCSTCGDGLLTGPEACEPPTGTRDAIFPRGTSCETEVDAGSVGTVSCSAACDRIETDDCSFPPPKPGIDETCTRAIGCQGNLFCDPVSVSPLVQRCQAHCERADIGTTTGCPSGRSCADGGVEVQGSGTTACVSDTTCAMGFTCTQGICAKNVGVCR